VGLQHGIRRKNTDLKCSYGYGLGHVEKHCWKKNGKGLPATTNYLEVLVNDEEATLTQLNRLCGVKNNVFLREKVPRHKNPVVIPKIDWNEEEPFKDGKGAQKRFGEVTNTTKSKILTHFLKGKISFTPLETILIILNEFEYLEILVKLARRCKDEEIQQVIHIAKILVIPTIKWVSINRNHRDKALHLTIKVCNGLIEGLVDTSASMSIMVIVIIRELGIMHLVLGNESYKITFCTITKALGRIMNIPIKVGNFWCGMVFLLWTLTIAMSFQVWTF
jgi:hypothetical protein